MVPRILSCGIAAIAHLTPVVVVARIAALKSKTRRAVCQLKPAWQVSGILGKSRLRRKAQGADQTIKSGIARGQGEVNNLERLLVRRISVSLSDRQAMLEYLKVESRAAKTPEGSA